MSEEQKENKPWPIERVGYHYNCTKGPRNDPKSWDPDPVPRAPSPAFHDEPRKDLYAPCLDLRETNRRLAGEPTATGYEAMVGGDQPHFKGRGTPGFVPDPDPSYEAGSKATNPKDGIGSKKAPLSTLSMPVVYEMALAMLDGGCKYRRHNYRIAGVRVSVYYDAAMRHINSWWEGEDIDNGYTEEDGTVVPGSGLPHLAHAMACLMIIRDGEIFDNRTDDRPPSAPVKWLSFINHHAKRIVEKYNGGKPPFVKGDEL